MSLRVASIEANTKSAASFIAWMRERYITFRTALQDVADAVFFHSDWEITIDPDDNWTPPVIINKDNCDSYRSAEPQKRDYHKELKYLLAWRKEREEALRHWEEYCIANGIEA